MKPASELAVAIVGCGRMGRIRATSTRAFGASIAALRDPDVAKATGLAEDLELGSSSDVSASPTLPLDRLDAVFVCTPPCERGPIEAACIEARVPFFVEKPIGVDARTGARLLAALGDAGLITGVGYMNRYRESVAAVRRALEGERLLGISALWAGGRYQRDWWLDPLGSGGPINEQATHVIDLFRWLGGEIAEVSSLATHDPEGVPSGCATTIRWSHGALGTLLYTCEAREKSIGLRAVVGDRSWTLEGWDWKAPGASDEADPFATETHAFLEAVRTGNPEPVLCDLRDALCTQRVMDAIARSVANGGAATPVSSIAP